MPLFELTYGGVPFAIPDDETLAWIDEFISLDYLQETLPGLDNSTLVKNLQGIAAPRYPARPKIKIGDLYYPTGATRWSEFHGVVDETNLQLMLDARDVTSSSSLMGAAFVMQCEVDGQPDLPGLSLRGDAAKIATRMYMLPPRKLTVWSSDFADQVTGMYLVSLVDERYFLQNMQTPDIHPDLVLNWGQALILIYNAILPIVELNWDAVLDTYGVPNPDSAIWSNYESAAVMIDAIAANIGCVCVRRFNGSLKLMRNEDCTPIINANRGGALVDTIGKLAGDDNFSFEAVRRMALPEKIIVTFPKFSVGESWIDTRREDTWITPSYGEVYAMTLLTGPNGTVNLVPSGTATTTTLTTTTLPPGTTGVKVIRDTARAYYDVGGTLINYADLAALATQLALDYLAWQREGLDEVYLGIRNWTPEGVNDVVWHYAEKLAYTRVMRKPWNYGVEEMQHAFPVPTTTTGTGTTTTTTGTTTTLPPCSGQCFWHCSAGVWVLTSETCDTCVCQEPNYCCDTCGTVGETTVTSCIPGIPTPQPFCGTTTTITTTTYTGTSTTAGPDCTFCHWKCLNGFWYITDPGFTTTFSRCLDTNPSPTGFHCRPCPFPTIPCTDVCVEAITYCQSVILTTPPPFCRGECDWFWNDDPPGWIHINPFRACSWFNAVPCICLAPSFDGDECGNRATTLCFQNIPTTTGTGTTGTGAPTTTPRGCTGDCRWMWNGSAWVMICTNCPISCACNDSPGMAGSSVGETAQLPCANTTTTTGTTTTGTTTTATTATTATTTPTTSCGHCTWFCNAGTPNFWSLTEFACSAIGEVLCTCPAPGVACTVIDSLAQTECNTSTTTTTTTPTPTTTTSTTTVTTCCPEPPHSPGPCDNCIYQANYLYPGGPGIWVLFENNCTIACVPCHCIEPVCCPIYPAGTIAIPCA